MAFILGKKLGMTRVFKEDGTVVPVTVIEAGPMTITRVKTKDTDGYEAVQLGYGMKKHDIKARAGQFKAAKVSPAHVAEVASNDLGIENVAAGTTYTVETFVVGQKVKISGIAKAKGFQGAVKRHGFSGAPASHGHKKVLRRVGSIGQRFPQHTLKGVRMAGRMGGRKSTTRGLEVIDIDPKLNTIAIKGAVPGRKGTVLRIVTL